MARPAAGPDKNVDDGPHLAGLADFPLLLLHGRFHFALGDVDARRRAHVAARRRGRQRVLRAGRPEHSFPGSCSSSCRPRRSTRRSTISSNSMRDEAARLVRSTCGSPMTGRCEAARPRTGEHPPSSMVVGTVRKVGPVQGKVVQAGVEAIWVPGSEALLTFHQRHVDPYLRADPGRNRPSARRPRNGTLPELQTQLPPEAQPSSTGIAELCDQRRQFDLQRRLHRWLHLWLSVHVPLSAALSVSWWPMCFSRSSTCSMIL